MNTQENSKCNQSTQSKVKLFNCHASLEQTEHHIEIQGKAQDQRGTLLKREKCPIEGWRTVSNFLVKRTLSCAACRQKPSFLCWAWNLNLIGLVSSAALSCWLTGTPPNTTPTTPKALLQELQPYPHFPLSWKAIRVQQTPIRQLLASVCSEIFAE